MSGIVGIFDPNDGPIDQGTLRNMADAIAYRGPQLDSVSLAGCHLLLRSHSQTHPLVAIEDGVLLAFEGRLDNAEELGVSGAESTASAVALETYKKNQQDFPSTLKGDFALVAYDPRARTLLIARDVMGGRTFYYANDGEKVLFASEIKALLAYPGLSTTPNDAVLAEFLFRHADYRNQNDTFFTNVHSVPPAHRVTFSNGQRTVTRYWDFSTKRLRIASQEEAVERYRNIFLNAVRRRLQGRDPVAITVSGGIDSSSIFCAAQYLKQCGEAVPPIFGINFFSERKEADERRYVADVEQKYGVKVEQFRLPDKGLINEYPDQTWILEAPFLQWNALHGLYQVARAKGARRFLSGFFGDQILFSPVFIMDDLLRLRWISAFKSLRKYVDWGGGGVPLSVAFAEFLMECKGFVIPERLRPVYQRMRRFVIKPNPGLPFYSDRFHRTAAAVEQTAIPLRMRPGLSYAKAILHQVHSRKHAAMLDMEVKLTASYGLELCYPFRDRDLIQFLLGLDGSFVYPNGVSRGIHREAMKGILPESIRNRLGKGDYTMEINQAIKSDAEWFLQHSGHLLATELGYLPDEARLTESLRRLVSSLDSESARSLWSLADVMGLESWLNAYFGDKITIPTSGGTGTWVRQTPAKT